MSKVSEKDEIFDPAFLDRLRVLFLRLRKRRQLKKRGMQSTPATGFTREFKDFRHYTPNDDYRSIDWRLYARLERLFIRLFEEVQEFHVHILLDTSGSMISPHQEKRVTALRLAVALAYMGLVGHHKVSLYELSDHVELTVPPLKGQGKIQEVIDALIRAEFDGVTQLEKCFEDFRPPRQRYGIIFVISDLFGNEIDSAAKALHRTAHWPGESHVIHLVHPRDFEPGLDGEVELVDTETREKRRMWLTKSEVRKYKETVDHYIESILQECISRQVNYFPWSTDQAFEDRFLDLLSRGTSLAKGGA